LGNGDVWAADDAVRMMRETGCAGVVVGRGCLGKPWLFRELSQAFAGEPIDPAPALGEVIAVMRRHVELLMTHKRTPELGVRAFRKHVGWYLTGFPVGGYVRHALMDAETAGELNGLLDTLDPAMPLPPAARNLPRGHLHGPRPVELPPNWRQLANDPTPLRDAEVVSGG
jgi:tRNA-dihydrouridine synthase